MKVYLFAAAAIVAVLFSCSKTEVQPAGDVSVSTFTARTVSTKITIDSEWRLWWEVDDAVAINDGSATYSFSADAAGSTTTLSREGFEIDAAADYHAVFPYAAVSGFSGSTATITVAGGRTAAAGVYPSAPSVAKTTGAARSFSFLNVCGLVSFVLTESDVASIVLFGGNGEDIAGTVTVSTETGVVGEVVAGEKSILLKPAAGSAFATGRYYVAVLPGSFSGGMSISLYKTDGTRVRRNINAFTLGRSTHVDLENVDEGRTWKTSYTIKNADELQAFLSLADRLPASSVVSLANDIDLGGVVLEPAASFSGTFDGDGHKLTNWTTQRPLFKRLDAGGTISNLEIAASCTLQLNEDSYNAASSTYTQGYLVGKNLGTVSGCINRASLSNTTTAPAKGVTRFLGLVVGENVGTVTGCKNYGNINLTVNSTVNYAHHVVGGICGKMDVNSENDPATAASIASCENHGKLAVTVGTSQGTRVYLGGILGRSQISSPSSETLRGTLSSCDNHGAVSLVANNGITSSATCVGGVAGYLEGSMTGCRNSGKVSYLANQDNSESQNQQRPLVGGVAGGISFGASGCINDAVVEVKGCFTTSNLANAIGGSVQYPCIGGVFGSVGLGTADGSLLLDDCDNNGALSVISLMNSSNEFQVYTGGVTGYLSIPAEGCDNAGEIEQKSHMYISFLGGVAGFTLCALDDCDNSAAISLDLDLTATNSNQSKYLNVGGIVAATSGTFAISDCDNTGASITVRKGFNNESKNYVGGIAGDTGVAAGNAVGFTNCSNSASIIATGGNPRLRVGGIVGQTSGLLDGCSNTGDIDLATNRDYTMIGGLAGYMKFTDNTPGTNDVIVGCTQNGSIAYKATGAQGNAYLGGLVARYDSATSGAGNDRKPRVVNTGITAAISVNGGGSATAGYAFGWLNYVSQVNLGVNSAGSYLTVYSGTSVLGEAVTSSNYNTKPSPALGKTSLSDNSKIYNGGTRYVAAAE